MASRTFQELLNEAAEAGLSTWTPEAGPYDMDIVRANYKDGKKGTPEFGVQWKVQGGPHDGKSFWDNFRFASPTNTAMTLKALAAFGLDADFFGTLTGTVAEESDKVIERLKQVSISCDLVVTKNGDFTNFRYNDVTRRDASADSGSSPEPAAASAATPAADEEEPF